MFTIRNAFTSSLALNSTSSTVPSWQLYFVKLVILEEFCQPSPELTPSNAPTLLLFACKLMHSEQIVLCQHVFGQNWCSQNC